MSTAEAEYVALSSWCQEIEWIRLVLAEIGESRSFPVPLRNDNRAAEAWADNLRSMRRAKHVDVRFHSLRECIEVKQVETELVESSKNWSDGFTKPLLVNSFITFRDEISLSTKLNCGHKCQTDCCKHLIEIKVIATGNHLYSLWNIRMIS